MVAAYDTIAEWYDRYVDQRGVYTDVILPALATLLGDIRGHHVLDLACGQGLAARILARQGAHVTGVDISEQLLALARRYEDDQPLGILYVLDDAQALNTQPSAHFDCVACNLALMDISDLSATFRAVGRVLKPRGLFAFSITHPCFYAPHSRWVDVEDGNQLCVVPSYLEEGFWRSDNPDGVRGKVGAYHRTLSAYVNTLIDSGFTVERFVEPARTDAEPDSAVRNSNIPPALLVRARLHHVR